MCLLGEEGLWSGETLPSLSLVVDEGGVGGSVNPKHVKQRLSSFTLHKHCSSVVRSAGGETFLQLLSLYPGNGGNIVLQKLVNSKRSIQHRNPADHIPGSS
jgi:hypothetical protein